MTGLTELHDVGAKIRLHRLRAGITQEELGRIVERPHQIAQFELGYALPSPGLLDEIAKVLGVSFADLTGADAETYRKTFPKYRGWVDDALAEGDWTGMSRKEVCAAVGTDMQSVGAAVDRLAKRGIQLEFAPEPKETRGRAPRLAAEALSEKRTKPPALAKNTGKRCVGCRFDGVTSGMHYCSLYLEEGRHKKRQGDGSCTEFITGAQWRKEKKLGLR